MVVLIRTIIESFARGRQERGTLDHGHFADTHFGLTRSNMTRSGLCSRMNSSSWMMQQDSNPAGNELCSSLSCAARVVAVGELLQAFFRAITDFKLMQSGTLG